MAIKHWPQENRPREKLLEKGPQALTDAELLAIFLRVGRKGVNAIDLARDLMDHFGGLGPMLMADQITFCAAKGLGAAKYCQLQATLELTKRYLEEQLCNEYIFDNPNKVRDYLAVQMRDYQREVFVALLLDTRHRLIEFNELFKGTINAASVYPRELAKLALQKNAAAVIVAHNHPSGNAEPSAADIEITRRLKNSLDILDIRLLDHFIVGRGKVISLADMGHM